MAVISRERAQEVGRCVSVPDMTTPSSFGLANTVDSKFMRTSKWLSRALTVVLLAFHGWLLATQWAAGRLFEPGVIVRWLAAIAIGVSLTALYRSGASVIGRKSMVIWLLAALLHGPAIASRTGADLNLNAIPESAITVVLQSTTIAAAIGLTFLLFTAFFRRRLLAALPTWSFVAVLHSITSLSDGFSAVVSARPPPARA